MEKTSLTVSNPIATYSYANLLDVLFNFMVDALVNKIQLATFTVVIDHKILFDFIQTASYVLACMQDLRSHSYMHKVIYHLHKCTYM